MARKPAEHASVGRVGGTAGKRRDLSPLSPWRKEYWEGYTVLLYYRAFYVTAVAHAWMAQGREARVLDRSLFLHGDDHAQRWPGLGGALGCLWEMAVLAFCRFSGRVLFS